MSYIIQNCFILLYLFPNLFYFQWDNQVRIKTSWKRSGISRAQSRLGLKLLR